MNSPTTPFEQPESRLPSARQPDRSGTLIAALILIALGVVFFLGNLLATGGSLLFVGLGVAFLVARVVSGRHGFAVPAGILLGFGTFVVLEDLDLFVRLGFAAREGAWFFILLGLGFLAVYLIGARADVVWPLIPAVILVGMGLVMMGTLYLAPLAGWAWIATYWPLALVLLGVWVLVRDVFPAPLRTVLGTIGALALALYVVVAVAATVASGNRLAADPRTGFGIGFPPGFATHTETVSLQLPVGSSQSLRVANSSGRTTIRPGSSAEIRVTATKYARFNSHPPEVRFEPQGSAIVLETVSGAGIGWVDYAVEMPANLAISITAASGNVDLNDLSGSTEVQTTSGDQELNNLSGPLTARSSSGDITLVNVSGETRVAASSGDVDARGVTRLREATTSSGDLKLRGVFADQTDVRSSSGDVLVDLAPASSTRVSVSTTSGSIRPRDITLANQQQENRSLRGTFGNGSGSLTIQTTSGDVTLTSSR